MCTINEFKIANDKDHIRLENRIMDIDRKVDYAIDGIEAAKAHIKASITTTFFYKGIVVLLMAILSLGGVFSYVNSKDIADTKIKTYKSLEGIRKEIRMSNTIAKNFDAVKIMDTLQKMRKDFQLFYNTAWEDQKSWTHEVYDNEIHTNTKKIKKNQLFLRDHELRLKALEN